MERDVGTVRNVAMIGAGMAGLTCALALGRAGCRVTVFDKGRAPGGRIATRRAAGRSFNHGAQYATARSPTFRALMTEMQAAGVAAPWEAAQDGENVRWTGVPGMSALTRHLALQLPQPVSSGRQVTFLHADEEGWMLRHLAAADTSPGSVAASGGELAGPFDTVLLALPAPQLTPLLAAIGHGFAAKAETVRYAPCWAGMASFTGPITAPDAALEPSPDGAWLDYNRPPRLLPPERQNTFRLPAAPQGGRLPCTGHRRCTVYVDPNA